VDHQLGRRKNPGKQPEMLENPKTKKKLKKERGEEARQTDQANEGKVRQKISKEERS